MGCGTYACHADTVEQDFVVATCPDEWAGLLKVLAENDYDLERLAMTFKDGGDLQGELEMDLDEENAKPIVDAYEHLCMVFQEKTGLGLDVKYHEREDRGDEVNGVFWAVDGVYVLSPAGEKYKEDIQRKFWTVFG